MYGNGVSAVKYNNGSTTDIVLILIAVKFDAYILPVTYKLPPIPTPPLTTSAPVIALTESVDDVTTRLLFVFVPILELA